ASAPPGRATPAGRPSTGSRFVSPPRSDEAAAGSGRAQQGEQEADRPDDHQDEPQHVKVDAGQTVAHRPGQDGADRDQEDAPTCVHASRTSKTRAETYFRGDKLLKRQDARTPRFTLQKTRVPEQYSIQSLAPRTILASWRPGASSSSLERSLTY